MWEYTFLRSIIENLTSPFLTWVFKIITLLGEVGFIFFALSIGMMFFKKTRKAGIVAFAAIVIVAGFNDFIIKNIIQRARPFNSSKLGGDALWLSNYMTVWSEESKFNEFLVPDSYSFMSGHTLSAFLFGFIVSFYHPKWSIPALLLSVAMAFSRLYFGFHFPTDVIGGLLTALVFAIVFVLVANKYENTFVSWAKALKNKVFKKKTEEL